MAVNLLTSSSPHIRGKETTRRIMSDVIIALIPAMAAGIYFFGTRALWVILATVTASVLAEYVSRMIMKKDVTVGDMSAAVTGVLLALNLPPTIPIWMAVTGGAVAIVIVKQVFGGIGQNFMNPALGARVILMISWPVQMTRWILPDAADSVVSATPLAIAREGGSLPSYLDMFTGRIGGCIGETSAAAILIGAAYLLYRKIIKPGIPLTYLATFAVLTWIFAGGKAFEGDVLFHLLAGGLMLGAFFMATDYSGAPMTKKGRYIFGFGCGVLTFVIRFYTGYPEGVSFAIILMNLFTPLIDMMTIPASFGGEKISV
jgi:Na+-translocating ferredoxin:NAD+ oxidoreductase subunit D